VDLTRGIARLSCGLLVGVALTVLALELASRRLDGTAYVRLRQAEYVPFTVLIGAITIPTLVAVVLLAVRTRKRSVLIALALIAVAVVVTLVVNGPINLEQRNWNPTAPPADWASLRDRWQVAHTIRTVALTLALAFLYAPDRSVPEREVRV
jgi:ABC-type branched-subunit amino acid transport system permease subunit